jgi:hypothetical protein
MLSFEGIIDKITVCKKLKSFTEEIFEKIIKESTNWPFLKSLCYHGNGDF